MLRVVVGLSRGLIRRWAYQRKLARFLFPAGIYCFSRSLVGQPKTAGLNPWTTQSESQP